MRDVIRYDNYKVTYDETGLQIEGGEFGAYSIRYNYSDVKNADVDGSDQFFLPKYRIVTVIVFLLLGLVVVVYLQALKMFMEPLDGFGLFVVLFYFLHGLKHVYRMCV